MNESQFTESVIEWLAPFVSGYEIATKTSVFYALSFDDHGRIQLRVDDSGQPTRGGGTGFEQDILVFERMQTGDTTIIPRVIAEVKYNGVTTHDALVYSEKARRIRAVYPFVRYGFILGNMNRIPPRILRLGQEFDFILAVSYPTPSSEREAIGGLFRTELQASRDLADMFLGRRAAKALHRGLESTFGS